MALKTYRPTSAGRRWMSGYSFEEITKSKPEKSLISPLKKRGGRNNQGRITVRHRGGGAKRMLRLIDFKRDKLGVPGRVASIEYDPNRSARIALIFYADGEKRYILAPVGLNVDDTIKSGPEAEPKTGNALPLKLIPGGTQIHNIELSRGGGGKLARSAGAADRESHRTGALCAASCDGETRARIAGVRVRHGAGADLSRSAL